jgi:hypothetical protein
MRSARSETLAFNRAHAVAYLHFFNFHIAAGTSAVRLDF